VDEAHNLLERARKMYSAELDHSQFEIVRRSTPMPLRKTLNRINRCWNELHKNQVHDYQTYPLPPEKFLLALHNGAAKILDYLTENAMASDGELQRFYFDLLQFLRMSDSFDQCSLFDITKTGKSVNGALKEVRAGTVLCLRNIIPAAFLQPRWAAAKSAILFSATLTPWNFYQETLGLPKNTGFIDVPSPFKPEQLSIRVISDISTRYRDRTASLSPIVDLISDQYREKPGNYLAFFSSFDYLQKVILLFTERYPEIPAWKQTRGMKEAERDEFLARFIPSGRGIGFAVLGGAFAEAIDLPGERLAGAFIATLGLPQINSVNEQIKQRMNAVFSAGYDYTYLFPGIQKVVQAAGRVIRTHSDKGTLYLIDDRFSQRKVLRLFPAWWKIEQQCLAHKTRGAG
jgi:DNA excision repair protein ERCC-2